MQVDRIYNCRVCDAGDLETIIDMGEQALTGRFPRPGEKVPHAPLDLVRCRECGLMQLRHTADLGEMYGQHYGYRSSLNGAMVRHLERTAADLKERLGITSGDVVIDIGANDGTFIKQFAADVMKLAIDPTAAKFADGYAGRPDIEIVPDFFTADTVRQAIGDRKVKLVTSMAMFYDLPDPIAFSREVASLLAPDGAWFIEANWAPGMLDGTIYDIIVHEHLEYYRLADVADIVSLAGLSLTEASLDGTNGGSFQALVRHGDGTFLPASHQACAIIEYEAEHVDSWRETFRRRVDDHAHRLRRLLEDYRDDGKRVLGYGASTRGNAILQHAHLSTDYIEAMAEVNPDKFGCVTPGTNIPIISQAEADERQPDVYLVMPWHYRDNILAREQAFLERGGVFVFPLPEIEEVRA